MDDGNDDVLIAVAKPSRGREMVATSVPIDMFDSIRQASVGEQLKDKELSSEKSKPRKENVETYYEGYIDGKKYLVPDSNLEAMKDMINLHMRQRRSTHYRHETSADVEDDMTIERIDKILSKVKNLRLSNSIDLSLTTQQPKSPSELSGGSSSETASYDQTSSKKSHNYSIDESLLTSQLPSLSKEDDRLSLEEVRQSYESQKRSISSPKHENKEQQSHFEDDQVTNDDCHLRLILSGHFRDNERPIYIIQEFDTKQKIFTRQSADFTTNQENAKVKIFISGKLFTENILEEIDGKPAFLNLKPNRVVIDSKKIKVFRSYFESTYNRKATDITIKGEFLKNETLMDITPFLSVSFQHNDLGEVVNDEENQNQGEGKRPSILIKDRKSSITSNSLKRVSFKDSLDDEVEVIYENEKKRKPNDIDNRNNTENKSFLLKTNNDRSKNNDKTIVVRRNTPEKILCYITKFSWLKNIFSRGKR